MRSADEMLTLDGHAGCDGPRPTGLLLREWCDVDGCGSDGSSIEVPGPVANPAGWIGAAETAATLLHGHPVEIEVTPIEGGGAGWAPSPLVTGRPITGAIGG